MNTRLSGSWSRSSDDHGNTTPDISVTLPLTRNCAFLTISPKVLIHHTMTLNRED